MIPWIIAIAFFMQMLDGTILNTALPAMARSLHESPLRMQSTVIAYMLTVAMLIPASGWLADRFGSRRIFQTAILLFSLMLLQCGMPESGIMCGMLRDRRMRSRCREQKRTRNGFTDRGNLILRRKQRL